MNEHIDFADDRLPPVRDPLVQRYLRQPREKKSIGCRGAVLIALPVALASALFFPADFVLAVVGIFVMLFYDPLKALGLLLVIGQLHAVPVLVLGAFAALINLLVSARLEQEPPLGTVLGLSLVRGALTLLGLITIPSALLAILFKF